MKEFEELRLSLLDEEWPYEYTDHTRQIVRAIVVDDEGYFYFVRAIRDDDFGKARIIETAGGGVEDGEDHESAVKRELKEELGAEVDILRKIGVVEDYYNLIHRRNINNYYLCRIKSLGKSNLTKDEINKYHLSTLRLPYPEAISEYENNRASMLGRLIYNREIEILKGAAIILNL